jgi:outer membrane biosynthesis protein TonB
MEIIIGLLVVAFGLWWAVLRKDKKTEVSAPYKVEALVVSEPVKVETPAPLVVTNSKPADNVPVAKKAPAKPRAAARTAKPKAPAVAKTTAPKEAKPKAPRKPKMKVAK